MTIPNINAQLTNGGMISGTVKDGLGNGLSVNVRLFSVLDDTFARAGVSSATGTGIFILYHVTPGDYKIFFNAAGTAYASEWYTDAASFALASVITVTEGNETAGINAQLAAPEINLKQGATDIASGGTHGFGSKVIGTDTDTVFTIENTWDGPVDPYGTSPDDRGSGRGSVLDHRPAHFPGRPGGEPKFHRPFPSDLGGG